MYDIYALQLVHANTYSSLSLGQALHFLLESRAR
jgi:hypothetical protein